MKRHKHQNGKGGHLRERAVRVLAKRTRRNSRSVGVTLLCAPLTARRGLLGKTMIIFPGTGDVSDASVPLGPIKNLMNT